MICMRQTTIMHGKTGVQEKNDDVYEERQQPIEDSEAY